MRSFTPPCFRPQTNHRAGCHPASRCARCQWSSWCCQNDARCRELVERCCRHVLHGQPTPRSTKRTEPSIEVAEASTLHSTKKNSAKYWSYRIAWSRISQAIDDGYHLEAVTIAESIIADRVLSFLLSRGAKVKPHTALHSLIFDFRKEADEEGRIPSDRIDGWRTHRNTLLHGILKSALGEAPIDMMDFVELAEITALEGRSLARRVSGWQKKQPSRIVDM